MYCQHENDFQAKRHNMKTRKSDTYKLSKSCFLFLTQIMIADELGTPSKKKCNKCYIRGGGGPDVKMLHFYKLCLKSISSHSESFWKKKIWVKNGGVPQYLAIFH